MGGFHCYIGTMISIVCRAMLIILTEWSKIHTTTNRQNCQQVVGDEGGIEQTSKTPGFFADFAVIL